MKTLLILYLASIMLMLGCKEEEQSQVCSCSTNTSVTTGFDSSFVIPRDTVTVVAGNSDTIWMGNTVHLIAPTGNWVSYAWAPLSDLSCGDCANPIANPNFTTEYTLSVVDSDGISQEFSTLIVVRSDTLFPNPAIYAPNIFTPNGDGINDELYVYGSGIERLHLIIKDGSSVIFDVHDQNIGWNGTINGNLVMDCRNFDYIVHVTFSNGTTYHIEGEVTLWKYGTVNSCPGNFPDCRFGNQFDGNGFNTSLSSGEGPC